MSRLKMVNVARLAGWSGLKCARRACIMCIMEQFQMSTYFIFIWLHLLLLGRLKLVSISVVSPIVPIGIVLSPYNTIAQSTHIFSPLVKLLCCHHCTTILIFFSMWRVIFQHIITSTDIVLHHQSKCWTKMWYNACLLYFGMEVFLSSFIHWRLGTNIRTNDEPESSIRSMRIDCYATLFFWK